MKSMQGYLYDLTLPLIILIGTFVSIELKADIQSINIEPSVCTKEDLTAFFPQPIVKAVLIYHHIPEDNAVEIAKTLAQKQSEIIHLIETKASQIHPNPFEDLSQRDVALKIFKETLYETLASTLKPYQMTNEEEIHAILEDTRALRGRLFIECLKKGSTSTTAKQSEKASPY